MTSFCEIFRRADHIPCSRANTFNPKCFNLRPDSDRRDAVLASAAEPSPAREETNDEQKRVRNVLCVCVHGYCGSDPSCVPVVQGSMSNQHDYAPVDRGQLQHEPNRTGVQQHRTCVQRTDTIQRRGTWYARRNNRRLCHAKDVTVNGAIKCQQISGGDGYSTMGDGNQIFMFSFGPLSGLADIAAGHPGTQFPYVFNTPYSSRQPDRSAGARRPGHDGWGNERRRAISVEQFSGHEPALHVEWRGWPDARHRERRERQQSRRGPRYCCPVPGSHGSWLPHDDCFRRTQ